MQHSHECRDCGHSILCNGTEDRHGACLRWDGGNDGCDECNGPPPAYQVPGTVSIAPDYDNLREWMLRAWADPKQEAFRDAVRADAKTLAWLNPPCTGCGVAWDDHDDAISEYPHDFESNS
jgi:hypothetical protein